MNQAAQDKLRTLRQRLAELEPYPWEPIEAWIASAKPLIKAHYGEHFDDFLTVTTTPHWYAAIRVVPGPYSSVDPRNQGIRQRSAAETTAGENHENGQRATAAKSKILAFLDGLLDLPPLAGRHEDRIEGLSDEAGQILDWLREQYLKAGYPNHKVWTFRPSPQRRALYAELRAHGYVEPFGAGNVEFRLTDFGQQMLLRPQQAVGASTVNIHHGDVHMGNKYTITNTNSTIGAQGVGDNITVTGSLTVGAPSALTQDQHKAAITQAQNALNADQDALERIDERLYQALGQFLTMARKIQVDQQSLGEVQAKMKETLDEVWAQQAAKGLRPQALPEGLKVIEALAKSPITAEVAKHLLAG